MAEDHLFNIKKFMNHVVWSPSWISNGIFAASKVRVKLGTHLTSDDAVICAYPAAKLVTEYEDQKMVEILTGFTGPRVEFTRSPWQHDNAALFLDASGNAAWFNADYCDALKLGILYGPSPMFATPEIQKSAAFFDGPTFDETAVVIMPMTVPVDWDQVARTVAASTNLESTPTATTFADMPAPPEEPGEEEDEDAVEKAQGALPSIAEALMDDLSDPNSESSKVIAASVANTGNGSSVTISSGGRKATFRNAGKRAEV